MLPLLAMHTPSNAPPRALREITSGYCLMMHRVRMALLLPLLTVSIGAESDVGEEGDPTLEAMALPLIRLSFCRDGRRQSRCMYFRLLGEASAPYSTIYRQFAATM